MSKKRIKSLYISYNAITEPIVESQVIPYLKRLSMKGIKFYLLTYEKKRLTAEEKNKIIKELGEDIRWFHLKYHKRPSAPATFFDIAIGFIYCFYIALTNKIDVVHVRAIVAGLTGFPIAKLLSKRFIFDTRGIDSEEYVDGGLWKRGGLKHRIIGFLEKQLVTMSDCVITLTEKFLRILKKKYPDRDIRFCVIPCATDTEIFKLKENKALLDKLGLGGKFIFTYIGSIGTWYMLEEMVKFFKVAKNIIDNAHFLILTQVDKDYVKNVALKIGIEEKSITIDSVPYNLVPEYLSLCKAGIFFIKPVFSKLSSSPVKFGEYLSMGLPVIINSGIGDTDSIVKANRIGAVIDKFDEASYANAVKEVNMLLETEGDSLKARCRNVAEKELSLKMATEKYAAVYEAITKGCDK